MTEQKHIQAFCPICEYLTIFISHADYPNRWICTNESCFGYTTTNPKGKKPINEMINPYTGLFGVREKGNKIEKVKQERGMQLGIAK